VVGAAREQLEAWWTSLRAPLDRGAWLQVGAVAVVGGVAGVLIVPGKTAQALDSVRNATPTITVAGDAPDDRDGADLQPGAPVERSAQRGPPGIELLARRAHHVLDLLASYPGHGTVLRRNPALAQVRRKRSGYATPCINLRIHGATRKRMTPPTASEVKPRV
jgi:hypothetical protein